MVVGTERAIRVVKFAHLTMTSMQDADAALVQKIPGSNKFTLPGSEVNSAVGDLTRFKRGIEEYLQATGLPVNIDPIGPVASSTKISQDQESGVFTVTRRMVFAPERSPDDQELAENEIEVDNFISKNPESGIEWRSIYPWESGEANNMETDFLKKAVLAGRLRHEAHYLGFPSKQVNPYFESTNMFDPVHRGVLNQAIKEGLID